MNEEKITEKIRELIRSAYAVNVDLETAIELQRFLSGIIEVLKKYGVEK